MNALAAEIAQTTGQAVPLFDATSGGTEASALLLLESPGPASTADLGSGIISPHNDDPTAEHIHLLLTTYQIPFQEVAFWNVVPWWLPAVSGAGTFRAPWRREVDAAAPWLDRLLCLLPRLQVVMTLGRAAQRGLDHYAQGRSLQYTTIAAPHPGNRAWIQPALRAATHAAFASLATLLVENDAGSVPRHFNHWP